MYEKDIKKALCFIKSCDNDFLNGYFSLDKIPIAKSFLKLFSKIDKENKSTIINTIIKKLKFIINQIEAANYHTNKPESILNLVSLSVTDYIINYVKEKHLIDPLLIARFVYIELSKVLYYDISYVKQKDLLKKRIICDTPVDLKKEKIFSYVVCTQWLQLYTYILGDFGIKVMKKNKPGQDHVWGEIRLNDNDIIVVDATDYIDSSIDLSNAKSVSPTVGFVVLPNKYSGIKLYDVFNDIYNRETAKIIKKYYDYNRELDISLGYINKDGYKVEKIIKENELFNYPTPIITNKDDLKKFTNLTIDFFKKLPIPNNIDGYEIFAYYNKYIMNLPKNIAANISEQTMYVDSFSYKQKKARQRFLHAPSEYLEYMEGLFYSRYYKYLSNEENNEILDQVKKGIVDGKSVRDQIAKYEMKIAEINRNLNLYYAIDKLQFYDPDSFDILGIQLYEPMMGQKHLNNIEQLEEFKKLVLIK